MGKETGLSQCCSSGAAGDDCYGKSSPMASPSSSYQTLSMLFDDKCWLMAMAAGQLVVPLPPDRLPPLVDGQCGSVSQPSWLSQPPFAFPAIHPCPFGAPEEATH